MGQELLSLTRRDFMRGVGSVALGIAAGLPEEVAASLPQENASKVVLVRDPDVVKGFGDIDGPLVERMLDEAMVALFGHHDAAACWSEIIRPDDVVGIKTNSWLYLPTPPEVEQAIHRRVIRAGVIERNIAIGDRGILQDPVFQRSTALINTRPMRTHSWSGVGSLLKNYITFAHPPDYHADACSSLAELWDLPITRGKTRLNILVMLTPQFHNVGPHHFDRDYTWPYGGLVVSTDPVAADTIGLQIIQRKRRLVFGREPPLQPNAHHIALADTQYHLGNADMRRIDLVRLGWEEDSLI